jgi:hypothetical protein
MNTTRNTESKALTTVCGLVTGQVITCKRSFFSPLGAFFRAGEELVVGEVHTDGQMSVICTSKEMHASRVWISDGLFVIDEQKTHEWNAKQDAHHKAMRDEEQARRAKYQIL